MVKTCNKADDLAKAGHVRHLDDFAYTKNYYNIGKYQKISSLVGNEHYLTKIETLERRVDDILFTDLKKEKPELKNLIENAELDINDKARFQKTEIIKNEHLSEAQKLKYEEIFKDGRFILDLKEFYDFEGDELETKSIILLKDTTYNFEGFEINIPKGYSEIQNLNNSFVQKMWKNDESVITVYKIQKTNKSSHNINWNAFKKNKKNILLLDSISQDVKSYRIIKDAVGRLGFHKTKTKNGKTISVDQEYNSYVEKPIERIESINNILK